MNNVHNILLVRLSALGDVAMMVPVVRTLQAAFPDACISWLIADAAYPLVAGIEGVDFIVIPKPKTPRDYFSLYRRLRTRKFDLLIAAQASLRANLLYPLIRARVKIGFDRTRARDGQWLLTNRRIRFREEHILDSIFAMLEEAGVQDRILKWEIPVAAADAAWAGRACGEHDGPVLLVNPGASKVERVWLPDRYIEVLNACRLRWNVQVVLTGSSSVSEVALAERIRDEVGEGVVNLVGQTTPGQLAALVDRADCLLAPDTGPVHIAVAMGTAVVGLYAVAPSWLSGPYGHNEGVVDQYSQAVRTILGQDPGQVSWGVRVHGPHAMELIGVDDVLDKLAAVFDRGVVPGAVESLTES